MSEAFGKLTVIRVLAGKKNAHRKAECLCACGNERTVRLDRLTRGEVFECSECSMNTARAAGKLKRRRISENESKVRDSFGIYRTNARRKGLPFSLTLNAFRKIVSQPCHYCGSVQSPSGVDRLDNSLGYAEGNTVPCCPKCNYAKRNMSVSEFIEWVTEVYAHLKNSGVLQRDRPVLLQLDEQSDGCRNDNAGGNL